MPDLRDTFAHHQLPLARWLQHATDWLVNSLSGFFRAVRYPVAETLSGFNSFLGHLPVWVFLLIVFALSWRLISTRFAFAATERGAPPFNGMRDNMPRGPRPGIFRASSPEEETS